MAPTVNADWWEQPEQTASKDQPDQQERTAKTGKPAWMAPQDRPELRDTREAEESED